jgi:hypothetical protein
MGSTGYEGPTGAIGVAGLTGSIGYTGPSGLDCTGPTGPIGPNVFATTPGLQGIKGVQGTQGITGATGITGSTGFTGTTGSTGSPGVTGSTGIMISGLLNNIISLTPYGATGTYNITPDTNFTWNINEYGKSIITLPSTRTSFNFNNFINLDSSSIFIDNFGYKYQVYVFTDIFGSFSMNNDDGPGGYINLCLIGGGGGGGGGCGSSSDYNDNSQGGSGAGQITFIDNILLENGDYNIVIGQGGQGGQGGLNNQNGTNGGDTYISKNSQKYFLTTGGAGGIITAGASNGIVGDLTLYPTPTNLLVGTSSASGGNKTNLMGGTAVTVNYENIIAPGINLKQQIWSYGNNGGNGYNTNLQYSGGGGGGAGGLGHNGTNTNAGLGGKGIVIYFDSSYGRAVCGGGDGGSGNGSINDYSNPSYNTSSYLYNYGNTNPVSGYPPIYSYGAGTINPDHKDAYPNTGSGGAPGNGIINQSGGNGGSGLFMIRYRIY